MPAATSTPAWYEIVWSWPGHSRGTSWVRAHSAESAIAEFRRRLGRQYANPEDAVVESVERGAETCPECCRRATHSSSCPLDW
jgi:hypothetical protein